MRRASAVLVVAALAVVGLAACGSSSSSDNSTTAASAPPSTTPAAGGGGAGGASTIDISTPSGSDLAFDQKDVSAKAGNVTIDFDNKQPLQHDVAVAEALRPRIGRALGRFASPAMRHGKVSPREADVLDLLCRGLTDRQIATRLGISPRTVDKHLEHAYVKLGVRCRVQAATRWRS
jgi:DNA-binding CsgD family transcriptional regulator